MEDRARAFLLGIWQLSFLQCTQGNGATYRAPFNTLITLIHLLLLDSHNGRAESCIGKPVTFSVTGSHWYKTDFYILRNLHIWSPAMSETWSSMVLAILYWWCDRINANRRNDRPKRQKPLFPQTLFIVLVLLYTRPDPSLRRGAIGTGCSLQYYKHPYSRVALILQAIAPLRKIGSGHTRLVCPDQVWWHKWSLRTIYAVIGHKRI